MEKTINVELTVPPTVLHAGMFLAEKRGYYREEGIHVKVNWPRSDSNTLREDLKTAVKELQQRKADVIVGGLPSVISFNHLCHEKVPLVAISSINNTVSPRCSTAIATLTRSGIDTLKKLENKRVGIFGYPFEEGLLTEMIKSEGGTGKPTFETPPFQHIFDGLKGNKYDAAHIGIPWHGVYARMNKVDIKLFELEDYDIPRHYPCFVTLRDVATGSKKTTLRTFLKATFRGYCDLLEDDPRRLAEQLKEVVKHDNMSDIEFITESIKCYRQYFGNVSGSEGNRWGYMREEDWRSFVRFLGEKKLLVTEDGRSINESQINVNSLFTNDLLGGTE